MDKIQPYIDKYKVSLISGGVAVGLSMIAKKLLKRELLPTQGLRKIAESFAFVALSAVAAQNIQKNLKKKPIVGKKLNPTWELQQYKKLFHPLNTSARRDAPEIKEHKATAIDHIN